MGFGDLRPGPEAVLPPTPDRVQAWSKISGFPPILRLKRTMMMTTRTAATVTDIEDAATARWLDRTLQPARARLQRVPDTSAIERIRARVLGEAAARRAARSIAA